MEAQLTDLFYFVTVGKPDPKMSQKEKLTKAIDKPVGTNVHHEPVSKAKSFVAQYKLLPQVTLSTSPNPRNSRPT